VSRGEPGASSAFPGHGSDIPPRPSFGDSERRRLGRRRSRFLGRVTAGASRRPRRRLWSRCEPRPGWRAEGRLRAETWVRAGCGAGASRDPSACLTRTFATGSSWTDPQDVKTARFGGPARWDIGKRRVADAPPGPLAVRPVRASRRPRSPGSVRHRSDPRGPAPSRRTASPRVTRVPPVPHMLPRSRSRSVGRTGSPAASRSSP
jgi:hypothetical protein